MPKSQVTPNHDGGCDFEGVKPKKNGQDETRQCKKPGCKVTVGVHIDPYHDSQAGYQWRD